MHEVSGLVRVGWWRFAPRMISWSLFSTEHALYVRPYRDKVGDAFDFEYPLIRAKTEYLNTSSIAEVPGSQSNKIMCRVSGMGAVH